MESRYVCFDGRQVVLCQEALPPPRDNEMLVHTLLTTPSIGTELAGISGAASGKPFRLGYSNVGTVLQVGSRVTRYKVGDRVACKMNHTEYFLWPEDNPQCYPVPETVADSEAVFLTLSAIAMHLVERAEISMGRPVVVVGQGTVGQLVAQVARLAGAGRVIAVDVDSRKLELSRQLQVDDAIAPEKAHLEQALAKVVPDTAAPVFIEVSGAAVAFKWLLEVAPLKSRIVLAGTYTEEIAITPFSLIERELDVVGAHQPKCPERTGHYFPYSRKFNHGFALECMRTGRLRTGPLHDAVLKPDEIPAFYDAAVSRKPRPSQPLFDWRA